MDQPTTSHFSTGPGWQEDLTPPEEFFCQLSDLEKAAQAGRRPRSKHAMGAAALLGLTGLTVAGALVASTCTLCYAVSAGGDQPLAFVRQEEAYAQAVCQVEEQVSAILDTPYDYAQNTRVALTIAPKEALQTQEQLTDSLMETVDQVRAAYVLTVDGMAAGACASEAEITQALSLAKDHYITETTRSVSLASRLDIAPDYLPAEEELLSPQALAEILLRPPAADTAEYGDTEGEALAVFAPAEEDGPAPEEGSAPETPEEAAAPVRTEDSPFLLVETVEEITYTQAIPSPTQEQETDTLPLGQTAVLTQGADGQETRTDRVTYRCGVETARENLSSQVLSDPTPTVVGVGTAQGVDAAQGRFIWPASGQITSPFGPRTIFGSSGFHSGLDIANATGTPLLAAASGTVTWSGAKGTYGNLVKVDHGNGFVTYYAHCSQLLVSPGDWVDQGQTIARMGATGRVTGPHIHFEVRWQDEPLDPQLCLP